MKIMKNENNGVHDKMLKMGGGGLTVFTSLSSLCKRLYRHFSLSNFNDISLSSSDSFCSDDMMEE